MQKEKLTQYDAKKILICDDDKSVSDFLLLYLKKEGFTHVDVASSAYEALERLAVTPYHLVLLDICLPGMNGIDALQRIKALNTQVNVIMITGYPEKEVAEKAVKLGAYDFIMKPFDLNYFKLAIVTTLLLDSK